MVPLAGNAMALHPMAGNEMSFQPVIVTDMSEEGVPDNSAMYAAFGVCALAVAGVSMSKQSVRVNRRVRAAEPVMQLREQAYAPVGTAQPSGNVAPQKKIDVDS